MKPPARPLALSLVLPIVSAAALAMALPAHAGHRHHGGPGAYPGAYPGHHAHRGHHVHHGRGHGGVWGPLIVGGLIGAALVGASTAQAQPQPHVVVPVAPPPSHLVPAPAVPPLVVLPPQAPAPRVQYFCAPYRAYYPFVTHCPEPWYVMPQ
ncbi:MAG: hypothetical protein ACKOGB_07865 [Betaproteobacteria bacterium]